MVGGASPGQGGRSLPPQAHTRPFSRAPPLGRQGGRLASEVDKMGTAGPHTVPAAARAAFTMKVISGASLGLYALLLLLQALGSLGLVPQPRGEGAA